MSSKPAQVRYVQGGKSLGAAMHKGWAATWNWVLSWIVHFAGGKGCKIVNGETGQPRLDVLLQQGDGIEITGGGNGEAYTISVSCEGGGGSEDEDTPDFSEGISGTKTVLADIQYDASSHKLQVKYASVTYDSGIVTNWTEDSQWTDVFTASPHRQGVS